MDFLNTLDVEDGTDELSTLERWRRWTGTDQGVKDLERARRLRDQLRTLARGEQPPETLRMPLQAAITEHGAEVEPRSPVEEVMAAVLRLSIEERLTRVKICPADDCLWAFYDASKNHSRQWCSMQVCGNRAKVRNHRERAARG